LRSLQKDIPGSNRAAWIRLETPRSHRSTARYDPPSEEECEAIRNGTAPVQDDIVRSFELGFDVVLYEEASVVTWVDQFLVAINAYITLSLAGCPSLDRRLLENSKNGFSMRGSRKLRDIRYAVSYANATLKVTDGSEVCEPDAQEPCYRVEVFLDLFLKGEEKISDLIGLILDAMSSDSSGRRLAEKIRLNLEALVLNPEFFSYIELANLVSTDNT
jgi:hypothetical protein